MACVLYSALGGIEMLVAYGVRSGLFCTVMGLVGWGCASASTQRSRPPITEVRVSIVVADTEPRMLLAGPARLLHLHVEKRRTGAVTIFRAQRNTGSSADCLVAEAGQE